MRVRLDRYEATQKRIAFRSLMALILGGIGVIFASFVGLLGVLMVVMEEGGFWEMRAGIVIGVFGGFFPFIGAALLIWRGVAGQIRERRLRDLAAFARHRPAFQPHELGQTMNLAPQQAERLVLEAIELGVLEHGDAPD